MIWLSFINITRTANWKDASLCTWITLFVIQKLTEVFKMGKMEQMKFDYTGFELEQNRQGIKVSQNEYAKDKIEVIEVKPQRARLLR